MLKTGSSITAHMDALSTLQSALTSQPYQAVHESLLLICLIRIQLQEIAGLTGSEETLISEVEPLAELRRHAEWLEGLRQRPATPSGIADRLDAIFVSLWSLSGSVHRQIRWHRPAPDQGTVPGMIAAALAQVLNTPALCEPSPDRADMVRTSRP